jgi:hypothetical protein
VMGASAGAGSGEFDIYRGCRRRELIRQEFLEVEDQKVSLINGRFYEALQRLRVFVIFLETNERRIREEVFRE